MKYCSRCGKELVDEAIICTGCGCACDPTMNAAFGNNVKEDKPSVGLCILAFLLPIFGVIYWAVKRGETPKKANAIGITALVSYVINIISTIVMYASAGSFFAAFTNFLT